MKIYKNIWPVTACIFLIFSSHLTAQVVTLSNMYVEVSNAQMRTQILRSNAQIKAKMDSEYLRHYPAEATNALSEHQLWLLDVATGRLHPEHISPEDLRAMEDARANYLTNVAAQSSFFFHVHGMTETEYRTRVVDAMRHALPPTPWPEPSQKQEVFEHCATVLRASIDTSQIEASCEKLTNQSGAASLLESLSKEAITNLDAFASLLRSPDLNSFLGAGYRATLSTTTNYFLYSFWPSTLTRDIEKRTPDGQHVIVSIRFFENGKVMYYTQYSTNNFGLGFNEDGSVRNFYGKGQNLWLPSNVK